MPKRTHPLVVKIDRALFEEVREMLRTSSVEHQRRCGGVVPWGAWTDLMDTILRDWLANQQTILNNHQHAKEFATAKEELP